MYISFSQSFAIWDGYQMNQSACSQKPYHSSYTKTHFLEKCVFGCCSDRRLSGSPHFTRYRECIMQRQESNDSHTCTHSSCWEISWIEFYWISSAYNFSKSTQTHSQKKWKCWLYVCFVSFYSTIMCATISYKKNGQQSILIHLVTTHTIKPLCWSQ